MKGKGVNLSDPILGGLPLPVTAQLRNEETGLCLEAAYGGAHVIENDAGGLKAKLQ